MADDSMTLGYALGRDSDCNNGNNGGWGDGNGWWVLIILFALFGGWNRGGYGDNGGGNGGAQYIPYAIGSSYTDSSLQRGFDTQNIIGKLDGINNGLCDGFYAVNTSLLNGFNGVNSAICNLGYQTQNGFNATQVAMMQGFNGVQAGQNALGTQLAQCLKKIFNKAKEIFCTDKFYAVGTCAA